MSANASNQASGSEKPNTGAFGCFAVLLYIIGGGLLLMSLLTLLVEPTTSPECDGKPMGPGDRCVTTTGNIKDGYDTRTETYEDMEREIRERERNRPRVVAITYTSTVVALVGAVVLTVLGFRRKRAQQRAAREQPMRW